MMTLALVQDQFQSNEPPMLPRFEPTPRNEDVVAQYMDTFLETMTNSVVIGTHKACCLASSIKLCHS